PPPPPRGEVPPTPPRPRNPDQHTPAPRRHQQHHNSYWSGTAPEGFISSRARLCSPLRRRSFVISSSCTRAAAVPLPPRHPSPCFARADRPSALGRLARLYEATGQPDEAATWRKELEAMKKR